MNDVLDGSFHLSSYVFVFSTAPDGLLSESHKTNFVGFPRRLSLKIVNISAHVIFYLEFYLNTDRIVSIRWQCGVRWGVLCRVVRFFKLLHIYFVRFTCDKFWGIIIYEKSDVAMSVQTIIESIFYVSIARKSIRVAN